MDLSLDDSQFGMLQYWYDYINDIFYELFGLLDKIELAEESKASSSDDGLVR